MAGVPEDYPEFPYPATTYDEPNRGQFHFSSRGGWMNDINAPIYYRGEWHIGRYWVERSRYKIIVLPDFDEPMARSHLQVVTETQESIPKEPRNWHDNPALVRPERAKELLDAIRAKAGG